MKFGRGLLPLSLFLNTLCVIRLRAVQVQVTFGDGTVYVPDDHPDPDGNLQVQTSQPSPELTTIQNTPVRNPIQTSESTTKDPDSKTRIRPPVRNPSQPSESTTKDPDSKTRIRPPVRNPIQPSESTTKEPESAPPSDGEPCTTKDGGHGFCVLFFSCSQLSFEPFGNDNQRCGSQGALPKICCPTGGSGIRPAFAPAVTIARAPITSQTPKITTPRPRVSGGVDLFPTDCGHSNASLPRISGGREAEIGSWPWMVAIYVVTSGTADYYCGGSIINSRYVVSAAHCFHTPEGRIRADELIIRVGDHNLLSNADGLNPAEYLVSELIMHKNFSDQIFLNDIALLRIRQRIAFTDYIQPICVPYDQPSLTDVDIVGFSGIVTGWGKTAFNAEDHSPVLQEVFLDIWSNKDCDRAYRRPRITEQYLCAGFKAGGKDSCKGDSGGPLMLPSPRGQLFLMGIVSFGSGCAQPRFPGVYTRVTKYLDWIQANMRP